MKYVRKTTGNAQVDIVIDDIYRILNSLQATTGKVAATNSSYVITDIGGFAVRCHNYSGVVLDAGYLVRASASSTEHSVTLAQEDDYDVCGVVYDQIPIGGIGYMVIKGWADVWFNANGAAPRTYFAQSRVNDTGNTDHGKAQSGSISKPDTIRMLGWVFGSITGEGLVRCLKTR